MLSKLASPAWAVVEYSWYPLLVFVVTPYFLHTLGPEKYGLWMLMISIAGIGGILSMGTGVASIKSISASLGVANKGDVERTIRSSLAIALGGGGALAVLVFGVFWFAAIFSSKKWEMCRRYAGRLLSPCYSLGLSS